MGQWDAAKLCPDFSRDAVIDLLSQPSLSWNLCLANQTTTIAKQGQASGLTRLAIDLNSSEALHAPPNSSIFSLVL
ncbi:hypothetical protein VTO42DRAFT_6679 [Malbranchea cinnamomea]